MSISERWRRTRPLPEDIGERIAALPALLAAGGVRLAYLFGSLARGEEGQDVDLALLAGDGPAFPWWERLRESLGTERVDLLDLGQASPVWRFEVLCTGRLLYAVDDETVNAFELAVLREYRDTAWLRRRQREALKRRMRAWCSG